MQLPKAFFRISAFSIFLFFVSLTGALAIDDGFGPSVKVEGKHFTVYYSPKLDLFSLARKLNVRASDRMLAGKYAAGEGVWLTDMLDTLFIQVCDILDMQLYSFRGTIKICKDAKQLNDIYYNFFQKDIKTRSFYAYSLNTIYTSADNFSREIIGHEIAHAVISHYFVVLPSVRIQEVLAMYVEYQLRQAGQ